MGSRVLCLGGWVLVGAGLVGLVALAIATWVVPPPGQDEPQLAMWLIIRDRGIGFAVTFLAIGFAIVGIGWLMCGGSGSLPPSKPSTGEQNGG